MGVYTNLFLPCHLLRPSDGCTTVCFKREGCMYSVTALDAHPTTKHDHSVVVPLLRSYSLLGLSCSLLPL